MKRSDVGRSKVFMMATVACTAMACGDGGEGTLVVTASGEEAAEAGFPVDVGTEVLELVDGWELQFDAIVVSIRQFDLRDGQGAPADIEADPVVVDLRLGEPTLWRLEGVPSGRWSDVRYRFAPPTEASRPVGDVNPEHVSIMRAGGYAMWIEATATEGSDTVEVAWGLPLNVLHVRCVNGVDDTDGVVIRRGGITEAEITVHLDHLFFDSLAEDEADMRFEAMAAVADVDGVVTLDALSTQSLSDPQDRGGETIMEGGAPLVYDPGPFALDAPNLREFLLVAAGTMGHFNGEGHCDYIVE
jgi:hypothetical protein